MKVESRPKTLDTSCYEMIHILRHFQLTLDHTLFSHMSRGVDRTQPNISIANRESYACHTSIIATRFSR